MDRSVKPEDVILLTPGNEGGGDERPQLKPNKWTKLNKPNITQFPIKLKFVWEI